MSGFDFTQAQGAGLENVDRSVLGPPILNIMQKGSAEIDETHKDHLRDRIAGVKAGDIVLASEKRIVGGFRKPLTFVPTNTVTCYSRWRAKSQGGGFIGNEPLSIVTDPKYRKGNPNDRKDKNREYIGDDELRLTTYVFVLLKDGNVWKKGIFTLSSTQLKHARALLKEIVSFRHPGKDDIPAPIFSRSFTAETAVETNTEGNWYGFVFQPLAVLDAVADEPLLNEAFTLTKAPLALVNLPQAALPATEDSATTVEATHTPRPAATPATKTSDDDVPF